MTTKKLSAGGEVDAFCTKCKLDLGHRIIAMVGQTIKRVECQTCKTSHNYKAPQAEKAAAKARAAERKEPRAAGTPARARSSRAASKGGSRGGSVAAQKEQDLLAHWEGTIAGQPASAFRRYTISEIFQQGDLLKHAKFGDGIVLTVIDKGKVEVLFREGLRTMAHGQP